MRLVSVVFCVLMLHAAAPVLAQEACENVGIECVLNDLGGNQFEYVFTLVNDSPEPIAIFKWTLGAQNAPTQWQGISFSAPNGWSGTHPDKHLDFMSDDNGSGNPERLFSTPVLHCGAGNTFEFRWKFENVGGPQPDCDFDPLDFKIHYQPVDPITCENLGQTLLCPGAIPVEPTTWSLIKALHRGP